MPVHIIGKISPFTGNLFFEILCNLKNYGIGRVIVRNTYKKEFPEMCFYVVRKVVPMVELVGVGPEEMRYGKVWVDEVYRGRKLPGLRLIDYDTCMPDYQLISKEEEDKYLKFEPKDELKILPKYDVLPPLLAEIMKRQMGHEPKLKIHYENLSEHFVYKVAEEGETPNAYTKVKIPDQFLVGIKE